MGDIGFDHRAERTPTATEPNPPGEFRGVFAYPDQYRYEVLVVGEWADNVDEAMSSLWDAMGLALAQAQERALHPMYATQAEYLPPEFERTTPSMPVLKSHSSDEVFAALRGLRL